MKKLTREEMLKYAGDFSQLFGVRDYTFNSGKAKGVRALEVDNGAGLRFTVLPDRALDIAYLSHKGINLSYIDKMGVVAPQFFEYKAFEFLRSFTAGFLTTCGLTQVGHSCIDDGEELGLHGRLTAIPADEVNVQVVWDKEYPYIKISGQMKEAKLFSENLVLKREIIVKYGENEIIFNDEVENLGFRAEPFMILYHMNFGYPLINENTKLIIPTNSVVPRDKDMTGVLLEPEKYNIFQPPTPAYREQVFFHDLKADADGNTCIAILNEELEIGVAIYINKNQLDRLTQWKMMGQGEYVLGIEPGNCFVVGRAKEKEQGTLKYIQAREKKKFNVRAKIFGSKAEIDAFLKESGFSK